eukprot:363023-Chlamydomonas_euryale.AAC.1
MMPGCGCCWGVGVAELCVERCKRMALLVVNDGRASTRRWRGGGHAPGGCRVADMHQAVAGSRTCTRRLQGRGHAPGGGRVAGMHQA